MPEHIHFIANPQNGDINHLLSQLKPAITQRIVEIAVEQHQQRTLNWLFDARKQCYRLWQESKYNFHLYTERLIWQKINYIHTNPIARGLVSTATEYLYSSYRAMYESDEEIMIPLDREFWWEEIVMDDGVVI